MNVLVQCEYVTCSSLPMDCDGLVELAARALHTLESFCIHLCRAGSRRERWGYEAKVWWCMYYISVPVTVTEVSCVSHTHVIGMEV